MGKRLGVSSNSLYKWIGSIRLDKRQSKDSDLLSENLRLKKALQRAEEERDILKKATAYFAKGSV